jgi:hypothetical protein
MDWLKRIFCFPNPKPPQRLYRQGDMLLRRIGEAETGPEASEVLTLAFGTATGHAHRVFGAASIGSAAVHSAEADGWIIDVAAPGALLRHVRRDGSDTGEHDPITLPPGRYQVRTQREYDPEGERRARD